MTLHEFGSQQTLSQPSRLTRAQIRRRVAEFEAEHSMTTAEFVEVWRNGTIPEEPQFVEWARLTKILTHLG